MSGPAGHGVIVWVQQNPRPADSVDDLDVIRAGGMKKLFGAVYAASTLGLLLRESTHGHTRQLSAAPSGHLLA